MPSGQCSETEASDATNTGPLDGAAGRLAAFGFGAGAGATGAGGGGGMTIGFDNLIVGAGAGGAAAAGAAGVLAAGAETGLALRALTAAGTEVRAGGAAGAAATAVVCK